MKRFLFLCFLVCSMLGTSLAQQPAIPLPSKPQLRWQKYEQTMFLCLDPCTWQGREYDNHSYPISKINPSLLDTDQWCRVAKSYGAGLILFVAKHTGGFCWWQTETTDYSVKSTPWRNGKGDVLKDLSESCKKYGLGLGVYVYAGDEQWGAGIGSGGRTKDPSKQEAYNKVYRQQLTEVLTNYGPVQEVWFDGSCVIDVHDILEKYASDAVIFGGKQASIRWVGNEDGVAPDPNWYTLDKEVLVKGANAMHSDVYGNAYAPVEVDVPLQNNKGHKWFWAPKCEHLVMSLEQLMTTYYNSVGRGSVLLLDASPDTTGLIPPYHVKRYEEFGREIKNRFDKPLARTSGHKTAFCLSFKKPTVVNHCIIQEKLEKGQRITSYVIEGKDEAGNWKLLSKGQSVGNKKIDYFKNITVKQLRLRVLSCKDKPYVRNFAAYNVKSKVGDVQAINKLERPKVVSAWQPVNYSEDEWKELEIDLTPYVTEVGQYDLSFNILTSDYWGKGNPGLSFKDWTIEMYGRPFPEGIKKLDGKDVFRIIRSQQTLDEFPTKFKVKVKRNPRKSSGEITIHRIKF